MTSIVVHVTGVLNLKTGVLNLVTGVFNPCHMCVVDICEFEINIYGLVKTNFGGQTIHWERSTWRADNSLGTLHLEG